jgi:hypothetical protein
MPEVLMPEVNSIILTFYELLSPKENKGLIFFFYIKSSIYSKKKEGREKRDIFITRSP